MARWPDPCRHTDRALTTFELLDVPPIVRINQATVTNQLDGVNGNPFTDLGPLEIRAVSYNVLDAAAYDSAPLGSSVAEGHTPEVNGDYSVDITEVAIDAMADPNATRIQLRYAFAELTNGNDGDDAAYFVSDSDSPFLSLDAYVE